MQKRTKIVATLGPASEDPAVLRKMIRAGLDVARINFSHGEANEHRARAAALKQAARDEGRDIGLLGDLQGPKIRVKRFRENSVNLVDGASFFLDSSLGLEDGTVEIRYERDEAGEVAAAVRFDRAGRVISESR